jgi:hypothetical protein
MNIEIHDTALEARLKRQIQATDAASPGVKGREGA